MRSLRTACGTAVFALALLAACADDGPVGVTPPGFTDLAIAPRFSAAASSTLPINVVRLTAREAGDGALIVGPDTMRVSPDAIEWDVTLRVPASQEEREIVILVELLNVDEGVESVEWSGRVGPLRVRSGESPAVAEVEMFPGPPGNLSITAVSATGAGVLMVGDSAMYRADALGASGAATFFWSVLDTIAAIGSTAGDAAVVHALHAGEVRLVAAAGPHADTIPLTIVPAVDAPTGATAIWLGATGTDWQEPGNWSTGSEPGPSDVVFLPASAPLTPTLSVADTIAGLVIEEGSTLGLDGTLVVTGSVTAAGPITGAGSVALFGSGSIHGVLPDLRIRGDFAILDTVIVGRSVVIAGVGSAGRLSIGGGGVLAVGDSLSVAAAGELEISGADALLSIAGNARFAGQTNLTAGRIALEGDFTGAGGAFRSNGTAVHLTGTAPQLIDAVEQGWGANDGHFDAVRVENPTGVTFVGSPHIVGGLTSVAGADIVAEQLFARDLALAGGLSADLLEVRGSLSVAGSYDVPSTWISGGEPIVVPALPYQDLHVTADSAVTDAAVTVAVSLILGSAADGSASLTLGAPLTIAGGLVSGGATGQGTLNLNGNRVDVGGDLTSAAASLMMTQSADTLAVAGDAQFSGPDDDVYTAGVIRVGGDLMGEGAAFHLTGTTVELVGSGDQSIALTNPGAAAGQATFAALVVDKPAGAVFIDSDLHALSAIRLLNAVSVQDTLGRYRVTTLGDFEDVTPAMPLLRIDSLVVGGDFSWSYQEVVPAWIRFAGAGQTIPREFAPGIGYPYVDVDVTGTATWAGPDSIVGDLSVAPGAQLTLGGATRVGGAVSAAGALVLGGSPLEVAGAFTTSGGGTITMAQPSDSLMLLGGGTFAGGSTDGLLSAGHVTVGPGAAFTSQGDAFRSTGTALEMQGDTLFMYDAGPAAGQGALSTLQLNTPVLVLDTAYVAGDVTELSAGQVVEEGAGGENRNGLLRVDGGIVTPGVGYTFMKLSTAGALSVNTQSFDVDSIEFTGTGQVVPVVDTTFGAFPYSNIIISGDSVLLSDGSAFLDLSADVIVRGAGTTAEIHSNDGATLGSLTISDGDPGTVARLYTSLDIDSIVVAAGELDLNGNVLNVNPSGVAQVGLRTTGAGVIRMDQQLDELRILDDALFEGGSMDGLLTAGRIVHADTGASFRSANGAFHSTGTRVELDVDTLGMSGGGQFRDLVLAFNATPELEGHIVVADSLIDPSGLGTVTGLQGTLEVIGGFATDSTGFSLMRLIAHTPIRADPGAYTVGVTELRGADMQLDRNLSTPLRYDTLVIGASLVALRPDSITTFFTDTLANAMRVAPGASLTLLSSSSRLVVDGDIVLEGRLDVDAADVESTGTLSTVGTGDLVMNNDQTVAALGGAVFAGGPTEGLLTDGDLVVGTRFSASGDAFRPGAEHMTVFTSHRDTSQTRSFEVNGAYGFGPDQSRFNDLTVQFSGVVDVRSDLYVERTFIAAASDWFSEFVANDGPVTIFARGLSVSDASLSNVTLDLGAADETAPLFMEGVEFLEYAEGVTRARLSHPGAPNGFFFAGMDWTGSAGTGGLYLDVADADGVNGPTPLQITVSFDTGNPPADWGDPARVNDPDDAVTP